MGHFGYKLPEAIRGEIGSTANNTIRSGIASEEIEFGDIVELTSRTQVDIDAAETGIGVRPYQDLLDAGLPILGVAIYEASSSNGKRTQYKYIAGDAVDIMTVGDVYMFVATGSLCLMGDPAYIATNAGQWFVTTQVTARRIGTFAETKEATVDNSVLVSINAQLSVS